MSMRAITRVWSGKVMTCADRFLTVVRFKALRPKVLLCVGCYQPASFDPALFAMHQIDRPDAIARAVPKRQAEFLAGRMMVQAAQRHLGLPVSQIMIGARRAPLWHLGMAGSITHSSGQVACLITTLPHSFVGLDLEHFADENALRAIEQFALTKAEIALLGAQKHLDPAAATIAVFSAKETLFKAINGQVGRYLGFDAAMLSVPPGPSEVVLKLSEDLGPMLPQGREFRVSLRVQYSGVMTWLILRQHGPSHFSDGTDTG